MSIYDKPFDERVAYFESNAVHLVAALKKHGPLNQEGLYFFVKQGFLAEGKEVPIRLSEFGGHIRYCLSKKIIYDSQVTYGLVCLPDEVHSPARLPTPNDYVANYYNLLERYEALKEMGEVSIPESVISGILGRKLYPEDRPPASSVKSNQPILEAKDNND